MDGKPDIITLGDKLARSGVVGASLLLFGASAGSVGALAGFALGGAASVMGRDSPNSPVDEEGLSRFTAVQDYFSRASGAVRLPLATSRFDCAANTSQQIFIHPKMVTEEDPETVAGLLAHETVHSVYGRGVNNFMRGLMTATVVGLVLSLVPFVPVGGALGWAAALAGQWFLFTGFNRHVETVCDRGSVALTGETRLVDGVRTCLDKSYIEVFGLRQLRSQFNEKSLASHALTLLMPHPRLETRQRAMEAFQARMEPRQREQARRTTRQALGLEAC